LFHRCDDFIEDSSIALGCLVGFEADLASFLFAHPWPGDLFELSINVCLASLASRTPKVAGWARTMLRPTEQLHFFGHRFQSSLAHAISHQLIQKSGRFKLRSLHQLLSQCFFFHGGWLVWFILQDHAHA
jgi:hypothetical protein